MRSRSAITADKDYKGKITVYPTNLRRFSFAYGLPKDSPWRTKIDVALMNFTEKPDWAFLLSRYGIGQNFEEIPYVPFNERGKIASGKLRETEGGHNRRTGVGLLRLQSI